MTDIARPAPPAPPPPPPAEPWRREEVERVIALIRFLIVVSVGLLQLLGTDDTRHYPAVIWSVVVVAVGYAVFVGVRLRWFLSPLGRWVLTAGDAVLSLVAVAFSGGARSPALAILILAVSSWAMRFELLEALLAASLYGLTLALIILGVPEPDLAQGERLQGAIWWPCYLLFAVVLTGILARVERTEHSNAMVAEAMAAQERQHRERLEAADRQREDLLRVITHEFRTPVASLQALTVHLAAGEGAAGEGAAGDGNGARTGEVRPGRKRAVELVRSHADHLATMVDALREVASSRDPDALDRVQLADAFLPGLLEDAVAAAGPGHGRVAIHVDPHLEIVRVDAAKVRRIVTNLVENALRHSADDDPVDVTAHGGRGRLEIAVLDRGPGLAPDEAALAFGKFTSLGDNPGTSGLGLWIVDQLAVSLGGWVEAQPRDGAGLEVRVVIPGPSA